MKKRLCDELKDLEKLVKIKKKELEALEKQVEEAYKKNEDESITVQIQDIKNFLIKDFIVILNSKGCLSFLFKSKSDMISGVISEGSSLSTHSEISEDDLRQILKTRHHEKMLVIDMLGIEFDLFCRKGRSGKEVEYRRGDSL